MNWETHPSTRTASRAQQETWQRAILARDHHYQIRGPHCTGTATEADHVHNIAEGGAELDLANGQGACRTCHEQKTQAEALRGRTRWKRKSERHPGLRGA